MGDQLLGELVHPYRGPLDQDLSALVASGRIDPTSRSAVITAYALCGFAHVASLAIFVGGVSSIAPSRTADLARLGLRALLAATIACMMTGAVAGACYAGRLPLQF